MKFWLKTDKNDMIKTFIISLDLEIKKPHKS